MISAMPSTKAGAGGQSATGKFRRVTDPILNQYIVVLDDNTPRGLVTSVAGEMARVDGGSVRHIYRYAIKGFSLYGMSEAGAVALSLDPRVEFVEEDGRGFVGTPQTITYPEKGQWGLDRSDQADLAVDGGYTYSQTGSGINAYVLDTGLRTTHQDFGGRASFGTDIIGGLPNNADCVNATFPDGHGTLVAGIIGGTDYGVAKSVNLIKVRVIDCDGFASNSQIAAGVDWVTGNRVKPAVANMSIQLVGGATAVDKAVRKSMAAGVTYVVIAGNQNTDAINVSPARVTQAITVGATGNTAFGADPVSDQRASFSNFGSVLDLFAPGVHIPSASAASDDGHHFDSGTSLAGPHVTGAAAQYLQVDPTACPSTVSEIITNNATSDRVIDPQGSPNKLLFIPQTWPTPTYYSLSLNGTTAYVSVPNNGMGVSLDITGPITLEAWIKISTNTVEQNIIRKGGITDGGYALKVMGSGKLRFVTYASASSLETITSNTVIATGAWHHVVGVFDGSQKRIYIDGTLDKSSSSTFAPGTGSSNLFIGAAPDGTQLLNGLVDEVRVTSDAVYSGSSFNHLVLNRLTGVIGTKGLWRFDRQNAKDCADVNNGTLFGGASFSTTVP
jgi:hypothetical protein